MDGTAAAEQPQTILILEDEQIVNKLFGSVLRKRGYAVLQATTSDEARSMYDRHPERVDLLIANVVLPEKSGPQFAAELIAADSHLKVLFCSGTPMAHWSEPDFQAMAKLPAGSYSFLAKPFAPEALEDKVSELLRTRR